MPSLTLYNDAAAAVEISVDVTDPFDCRTHIRHTWYGRLVVTVANTSHEYLRVAITVNDAKQRDRRHVWFFTRRSQVWVVADDAVRRRNADTAERGAADRCDEDETWHDLEPSDTNYRWRNRDVIQIYKWTRLTVRPFVDVGIHLQSSRCNLDFLGELYRRATLRYLREQTSRHPRDRVDSSAANTVSLYNDSSYFLDIYVQTPRAVTRRYWSDLDAGRNVECRVPSNNNAGDDVSIVVLAVDCIGHRVTSAAFRSRAGDSWIVGDGRIVRRRQENGAGVVPNVVVDRRRGRTAALVSSSDQNETHFDWRYPDWYGGTVVQRSGRTVVDDEDGRAAAVRLAAETFFDEYCDSGRFSTMSVDERFVAMSLVESLPFTVCRHAAARRHQSPVVRTAEEISSVRRFGGTILTDYGYASDVAEFDAAERRDAPPTMYGFAHLRRLDSFRVERSQTGDGKYTLFAVRYSDSLFGGLKLFGGVFVHRALPYVYSGQLRLALHLSLNCATAVWVSKDDRRGTETDAAAAVRGPPDVAMSASFKELLGCEMPMWKCAVSVRFWVCGRKQDIPEL